MVIIAAVILSSTVADVGAQVGRVFPIEALTAGETVPFEVEDQPDQPEQPGPDEPPVQEEAPRFLRPPGTCPQDLDSLVSRLLQDLPTYSELVAGRSLELRSNQTSPFGTVITVGEPDYEPIALANSSFNGSADDLQQVFFTTLERQYWQGRPFSLQNYHWLFLAEAENGWYLSQMYSSLGSYPAEAQDAPSPPQESSDGIVGQAVTLWLRDCRAGAVFPPEEERGW